MKETGACGLGIRFERARGHAYGTKRRLRSFTLLGDG